MQVINDNDIGVWYLSDKFLPLKEYRKLKLNKILNESLWKEYRKLKIKKIYDL